MNWETKDLMHLSFPLLNTILIFIMTWHMIKFRRQMRAKLTELQTQFIELSGRQSKIVNEIQEERTK